MLIGGGNTTCKHTERTDDNSQQANQGPIRYRSDFCFYGIRNRNVALSNRSRYPIELNIIYALHSRTKKRTCVTAEFSRLCRAWRGLALQYWIVSLLLAAAFPIWFSHLRPRFKSFSMAFCLNCISNQSYQNSNHIST